MINIMDLLGLGVCLLIVAFIIAVVFIVTEINDLKRKSDGHYDAYNDIFTKVNSLYQKDSYGTERPKVDVLQDWFENSRSSFFEYMEKTEDKLDKLKEK